MQGDLATTSPVEVCTQLARAGATGTLALTGRLGEAVLVLRGGALVGGYGPSTGPEARLGERLVTAGRLVRSDLEDVLLDQSADPAPRALGQLLLDRGLAASDAVRVMLQEQVIDIVGEVVGWREGVFEFEEARPAAAAIDVGLPVDRVLMEVRRRDRERDLVARVVPDPTTVPRRPAPRLPVVWPRRATPRSPASPPVAPSFEEARVSELVDGERSVGDIAELLGLTVDEASRVVYRLALQGRVDGADRNEAVPSTEESPLSAAESTGSVGLADDHWASLGTDSAAARVDEPEPWVGWANGGPNSRPISPDSPRQRPAPASAPPSVSPAAPPDGPHPPATTAPSTPAPLTAPVTMPGRPVPGLDADTRRAMFSELHQVGRRNPTISSPDTPAAPPAASSPPRPVQRPPADPARSPGTSTGLPPAASPESLSRSDVADLLRELHDLNLDD